MFQRFIILSITVFVFIVGCRHEYSGPKASDKATGAAADTVCFTEDVLPFFQSTCATAHCHDTATRAGAYSLFDYTGISKGIVAGQPAQSAIMKVINQPNGNHQNAVSRMSPAMTALLNKWILQEARYTVCDTSCDTSVITFSRTVFPVIQKYCLTCHSDSANGGGYLLTNYTNVKAFVDNGWLYHAIVQDSVVNPMPKYGTPLAYCKQRKIIKWINAGAPDN